MSSIFLKPRQEYKRNIDHIRHYVEQMSFYISVMQGITKEEAKNKIVPVLKSRFVDPTVVYYERRENGDKHKGQCKLTTYIRDVINNEDILAPTFTVYVNQKTFVSPFSDFMIRNKKRRSISKKKGHAAKQRGDILNYIFNDKEQANYKKFNNAGSGCFASKGSILYNPTCHSTLTSTVRTESSISNASNEKFLEGNRFYKDATVVLNNLISICAKFDAEALKAVMLKYKLRAPTVQEVMDCINRSYELYSFDQQRLQTEVLPFVRKLSDEQRSAFMFIGDLYHLRICNPHFVRDLLDNLSRPIKATVKVEKPYSSIRKFQESIGAQVNDIFADNIAGLKPEEIEALDDSIHQDMFATAQYIHNFLQDRADFIKVFFMSEHIPASTAYIYDQVRRCVPCSDTDATMFSVDGFVQWRFDKLYFDRTTMAFASATKLLATEIMAHQLAIFSANLGVTEEKIYDISMKPEYTFPVYAQSPVAKHYYTFATVQEGFYLKEPNWQIKGVHLKNSSHPDEVTVSAEMIMKGILWDLYQNKPLKLTTHIQETADFEKKVKASVLNNETSFFKNVNMLNHASYKAERLKSPFKFHDLWLDVFAKHYGEIEEPEYKAVRIPLLLKSKMKTNQWLASIENKQIANGIRKWMDDRHIEKIGTVIMNAQQMETVGIPKEIIPIIDFKRIILEMTGSRRLILSSMGVYPKQGLTITEMYEGKL